MQDENYKNRVFKSIAKLILVGSLISVLTIGICLLLIKTNYHRCSDILTLIGIAVISLGIFGIQGTHKTAGSLYFYQNSRSVSAGNSCSKLKQDFDLIDGAYSFFVKALLVSCPVLIFSIIVYYI